MIDPVPSRSTGPTRRPVAVLLAAAGLAILVTLTACAGGGSSDTGTPATEEATSSSSSTSTASTTTSSTTTTTIWPRTPAKPLPAAAPIPVLSRIDTTDPVVFLTIDDGAVRDPRVADLFERAKIPVALFLTEGNFLADPAYFLRVASGGGSINSHTRSHTKLTTLGETQQRNEVCGMRDVIAKHVLVPGHLFRSPYGVQNATTQKVAASCGINAILFWRAAINDGRVQFQQGTTLRPGDIVLSHFRPDLYEGIVAFLFEAGRAGLTVAPIENYLPLPD